mmetsp:Transcript_10155/g.32697  ORF Transcript_10155/g.32697 Transcript_10155/m.32697 type:complete len:226 (+) Transcript_10155:2-679(+)
MPPMHREANKGHPGVEHATDSPPSPQPASSALSSVSARLDTVPLLLLAPSPKPAEEQTRAREPPTSVPHLLHLRFKQHPIRRARRQVEPVDVHVVLDGVQDPLHRRRADQPELARSGGGGGVGAEVTDRDVPREAEAVWQGRWAIDGGDRVQKDGAEGGRILDRDALRRIQVLLGIAVVAHKDEATADRSGRTQELEVLRLAPALSLLANPLLHRAIQNGPDAPR